MEGKKRNLKGEKDKKIEKLFVKDKKKSRRGKIEGREC